MPGWFIPPSECFDVPYEDDTPPYGGYTCGDCPSGLEGDGETCQEIDGCADSPCYPGVECTDVMVCRGAHKSQSPVGSYAGRTPCALPCLSSSQSIPLSHGNHVITLLRCDGLSSLILAPA